MGSGTPIAQGATIPQSAPAAPQSARAPITIRGPNGFTTFTPAAEPLKGKTFATTDRRNIPTILDRVAAGQKVDGFEIVSSSPPPPSPTRQAEREASRPINPATGLPFDGFAGIPNLTTGDLGGDLVQTGDSGIPDDFDFQSFIDSQNFTPAPSVSSGSAFADDDFADFKNFGGFFPGEARDSGLSSDFGLLAFTTGVLPGFEPSAGSIPLPFNPETVLSGSREEAFLQTLDPNFKVGGAQPASPTPAPTQLPQGLPALSDITRQVEEFERQGPPPSPPPPALSSNAAEAQQQINAANILQALETQTPGSVGKDKLGFASQILKENFDRKRGDTTFDAFNPSSLGSGVKVAGVGDALASIGRVGKSVVNFLTPENRLDQARRVAAENAARKGRGVPPAGLQRAQEAAALTNPVSGGVSGPTVPNVQVGGAGRQGTLVPSSQQVIRALAAPDGKGGLKPRRSVFDVLFNSDPPPPKVVPSTTVQIPLGIRDRLLDDAQGRARGGLVGLMRKGN
tara:strand:+ start:2431 stop:3966 length:1536 start_codon:yes stop_codon:yes gene_type:complete